MRAKLLRPIDPGEIRTETFDFTADLGTETIASADPVTASVVRGGDDPTPADILNGASTTSGVFVYQSVTGAGAVANVDYKLRSRVTTNTGRKLVLVGILPVRTA